MKWIKSRVIFGGEYLVDETVESISDGRIGNAVFLREVVNAFLAQEGEGRVV